MVPPAEADPSAPPSVPGVAGAVAEVIVPPHAACAPVCPTTMVTPVTASARTAARIPTAVAAAERPDSACRALRCSTNQAPARTRRPTASHDPAIGRLLRRTLTEAGNAVFVATDGASGLSLALSEQPDVVLLDLGLPDLDGRQVLTMLRAVSQVPVIVITAQDEDRTIVAALDAGADDYLVKPFGGTQLAARISAVLRRSAPGPAGDAVVRVGELEIDPAARQARLAGERLDLSRKEFDLLWLLASRPGEVVTRRELLADVWGLPFGGGDRTVDVHLSWLRRKLGETAAEPRYLHTVRGVGVRLVAPGEA